MEPKGEFLLQLLQGGGVGSSEVGGRMPQPKANGDRIAEGLSILDSIPGEGVSSTWQYRDPAVAALGPSHSFHGDIPSQILQPNQLFMPQQYGGLSGAGVWTPQQLQYQHQHHQFFLTAHDPRGYGGLHARGPDNLMSDQFPRQSDASWPPPPHLRQAASDGGNIAGAWNTSPVQGSLLETPLPPPLSHPSIPSQQQFLGNGAELLQLLLGESSQSLGSSQSTVRSAKSGSVSKPGPFPEELFGEELNGRIQADNVLPRTQVHGPIGPPKRNDATQPEQSPPGSEDLLGRFWATAGPVASGSPESSTSGKPSRVTVQQDRLRNLSLSGGHTKEGLNLQFDVSKPHHLRMRESSSDHSKSKVIKPPGFFGESDQKSGGVVADPKYASPSAKALNRFSDFEAAVKGTPGVWDKYQEETFSSKQDLTGRLLDDRGMYQTLQNSSRFSAPVRNRVVDGHLKTSRQNREETTNSVPADFTGTFKENEIINRDLGKPGMKGNGRRGGPGRAELSRTAGRSGAGHWVVVNDKQRELDGEREPGYVSNLHGLSASLEKGVSSPVDTNTGSSYSSPQAAKLTSNSGKEDSPNGSGGKSKEDSKRRRGQIQEWRMKQPSPPHAKPLEAASGTGLVSQQDAYPEGILPLASQVDRPGLPSNMVRHSMSGSATDESKQQLQYQLDEGVRPGVRGRAGKYVTEAGRLTWEDGLGGEEEEDLIMREFSGYAKLVQDTQHFSITPRDMNVSQSVVHAERLTREEVELEGKHENLRDSREVRRHQLRNNAPTILMKGDVKRQEFDALNPLLLSVYKKLIPPPEEVLKQRKFLTHLDRLVSRDWGGAKLFLFGSCANDFGVCNSDIDVCLSVDDEHSSKAELVMKMAGILRSDNMQNIQALTHARVPIVKFTDPDTGINCDICVNNMLAVVNSKLLHDYSQVDPRLRQLAFLVKHWAKQRQVNETYRGTLSSYAYVLMCIHFLQQRRPAILPCLQSMQPTYEVTVGKIKCAYFDKVNTLRNFGCSNKETVGELLTHFFDYWASCHDYTRSVISVRTGGYLSKDEKDWTRRIGNERHLICIEDPFEITHDLGRVVDRNSIRVLRDEFKRAAKILHQDSNPATALFEPFIREA